MLHDLTNHIIEDIRRFSELKQNILDMLEDVWGTVGYDIEDQHFAGLDEKIDTFIYAVNNSGSEYNEKTHDYWSGLNYEDKVMLVKEANLF